MISDGQVITACAVLHAYTNEELSLDNDLLDELEDAIEKAFDKLCGPVDCDIDDGPPLAESA